MLANNKLSDIDALYQTICEAQFTLSRSRVFDKTTEVALCEYGRAWSFSALYLFDSSNSPDPTSSDIAIGVADLPRSRRDYHTS